MGGATGVAYLPTLGEFLQHLVRGEEAENTVRNGLAGTEDNETNFILKLIRLSK